MFIPIQKAHIFMNALIIPSPLLWVVKGSMGWIYSHTLELIAVVQDDFSDVVFLGDFFLCLLAIFLILSPFIFMKKFKKLEKEEKLTLPY